MLATVRLCVGLCDCEPQGNQTWDSVASDPDIERACRRLGELFEKVSRLDELFEKVSRLGELFEKVSRAVGEAGGGTTHTQGERGLGGRLPEGQGGRGGGGGE